MLAGNWRRRPVRYGLPKTIYGWGSRMPSIGPGLGIELPELAARAMVARSEKELGPLTILVNNAGVSWQGTLDSYDAEQVARMRRINVEGLIHATRAVIGCMRKRRYGRVVNVSSIAARFAA